VLDGDIAIWGIIIAQAVLCGALSSWLATQKGCDGSNWFWVGFLLSVLGVIVAAGMPKKEAPTIDRSSRADEDGQRLQELIGELERSSTNDVANVEACAPLPASSNEQPRTHLVTALIIVILLVALVAGGMAIIASKL